MNPNTLALTKYVRTGNSFFIVAGKDMDYYFFSAGGDEDPANLSAKRKKNSTVQALKVGLLLIRYNKSPFDPNLQTLRKSSAYSIMYVFWR